MQPVGYTPWRSTDASVDVDATEHKFSLLTLATRVSIICVTYQMLFSNSGLSKVETLFYFNITFDSSTNKTPKIPSVAPSPTLSSKAYFSQIHCDILMCLNLFLITDVA